MPQRVETRVFAPLPKRAPCEKVGKGSVVSTNKDRFPKSPVGGGVQGVFRSPVTIGPDVHPLAVLPARLEFPSVAVSLSVVEYAFPLYRSCFPVALGLG